MSEERGWIVCSDGVSSINVWRWTVIEHYSLERWFAFIRAVFPNAKGYAVGAKLFNIPSAAEVGEWNDRRLGQELDSIKDSLARLAGREVTIFVKDFEDLRREKYAAQQAAKAAKAAEKKSKNNNNNNNKEEGKDGEKKVYHNTQKKEKKKKEGAANKQPKQQAKAELFPGHVDIRVGLVKSAEPHPDGDTLYVEQIDVGEEKPRTIVSGIKAHVPLDKFVGSRVLVMCNLKEKPLRGVPSNGMICCGSVATEDGGKKVRLLEIPEVAPGTRVEWGEGDQVAADPTPIAQKKLQKIIAQLKTDKDGAVVFGDKNTPCHIGNKAVTCKELPNGQVG